MPRAVPDAPAHGRAPSRRAPRRAVDRWGAGVIVVAGGAAALAGLAFAGEPPAPFGWASPVALGLALVGMAVIAAASVMHRALQVRRLTSRLEDERVLSTAYSNRVRDLSALVSAGDTINGVLELDRALPTLLEEALTFFHAGSGSIMLLDGAGFLQTVCALGNDRAADARVKMGHSIAGHVALTREPLLLDGEPSPDRFSNLVERDRPVQSAMSVPLIHREEVLGVLNVSGEDGQVFTDHDLQLATVFASHVSVAIANARIFDSARDRLSQLAELNRAKSELISAISQDLKDPVMALSVDLDALRHLESEDERAREALQRIRGHVARLTAAMGRLLAEAESEGTGTPPPSPSASTDLRLLALAVARDFRRGGKPVDVHAHTRCTVAGDPDLLQQVLWNLVENAFQHGAPPVRIEVRSSGDNGVISVIDCGPGLAPDDRKRIDRLASDGATEHVRMGLGLSVAHAIVSGCAGTMWAEDVEEGGAAFHVAIPLAETAREADDLREVSA